MMSVRLVILVMIAISLSTTLVTFAVGLRLIMYRGDYYTYNMT